MVRMEISCRSAAEMRGGSSAPSPSTTSFNDRKKRRVIASRPNSSTQRACVRMSDEERADEREQSVSASLSITRRHEVISATTRGRLPSKRQHAIAASAARGWIPITIQRRCGTRAQREAEACRMSSRIGLASPPSIMRARSAPGPRATRAARIDPSRPRLPRASRSSGSERSSNPRNSRRGAVVAMELEFERRAAACLSGSTRQGSDSEPAGGHLLLARYGVTARHKKGRPL